MVTTVESYATQAVTIGKETVYAQAVSPLLKLLSLRIPPQAMFAVDTFTPSGDTAPSLAVVNDDDSAAAITGRMDYQAGIYPFGSMIGEPVSALVGTLAHTHVFTWDGRTPIKPVPYSLGYGSPTRGRLVKGFIFSGFSSTVRRSGLDFSGTGFGREIETGFVLFPRNEKQSVGIDATGGTFTLTFDDTGANPQVTAAIAFGATAAAVQSALEALSNVAPGDVIVTGGPGPTTDWVVEFDLTLGNAERELMTGDGALLTGGTTVVTVTETQKGGDTSDIAPQPMFPLHFNIYADDLWANLGTTQLAAIYSMGFGLSDRVAPTKPINRDRSFDSIVEVDEQSHAVSLLLGADATAEDLINTIRAGDKKFIRIHAVGPEIEVGHNFEFTADFAMLLTAADAYGPDNSVHVLPWSGVIARDDVSGKAMEVTFKNKLATL